MLDTPRDQRATDDAPIFIVGDARSGTTLMRLVLSAHPRIYICHESFFYLWSDLCPRDFDSQNFLNHYFQTASFRWLRIRPADVLAKLPPELPRRQLGMAFREIMRQKSASYGRVRYGDKTPLHCHYLRQIYDHFPNARVIQMVRDPRAEVISLGRMPLGAESDLANCLFYEATRRRVTPYKQRVLAVKLEDLLSQPEPTMRRVLSFVGEEWDDAVLNHAAHRVDEDDMPRHPWLEQAGTPLAPAPQRNEWREPDRVRLIEAICRKSMETYGYPRADLENAPGAIRTVLRLLQETPQALGSLILWLRIMQRARSKELWQRGWSGAANVGGSAQDIELVKKLNPRWWREHADYKVPAPPLLDSTGLPTKSAISTPDPQEMA